jgi:hypothetical protein
MSKPSFYEGLHIKFKDHIGYVNFISDEYITLCINSNPDPLRDVCILIYPHQWDDIELMTGNRTHDK